PTLPTAFAGEGWSVWLTLRCKGGFPAIPAHRPRAHNLAAHRPGPHRPAAHHLAAHRPRPRHRLAAKPPMPASALAPFRVRSFRFQWPADLLTSWAFEMEMLILGWYVLVETGSVLLLSLYASLLYLGTLVAPMIGVVGDRFGHRTVQIGSRGGYAASVSAVGTIPALCQLVRVSVLYAAAVTVRAL